MLGILLLLFLAILIYLIIERDTTKIRIPCIIGGSADSIVEVNEEVTLRNLSFLDWRLLFHPQKTFIGRMKGNSMKTRDLLNNDLVFGRKVNPISAKFRKGDLLIIKITDSARKGFGGLKIREFREELPKDKIQTIKYNGDTPEKSDPHNRRDVIAIIDKYYRETAVVNCVKAEMVK